MLGKFYQPKACFNSFIFFQKGLRENNKCYIDPSQFEKDFTITNPNEISFHNFSQNFFSRTTNLPPEYINKIENIGIKILEKFGEDISKMVDEELSPYFKDENPMIMIDKESEDFLEEEKFFSRIKNFFSSFIFKLKNLISKLYGISEKEKKIYSAKGEMIFFGTLFSAVIAVTSYKIYFHSPKLSKMFNKYSKIFTDQKNIQLNVQ